MIKATLQGTDLAERVLKAGAEKLSAVDAIIGASTLDMVAVSKRLAPNDRGGIINAISSFKERDFVWVFVCQKNYAAFVEFGTRSKVTIPPGLEGFVSTLGKVVSTVSAKQAIFDWCARHGIEKRAWYAIFVKIMTVGINPQPFFFPAFEKVRPQMIEDIKKVL